MKHEGLTFHKHLAQRNIPQLFSSINVYPDFT